MTDDPPSFDELNSVKQQYEAELLEKPGVKSVGIGIDAIVIGLEDDPDALASAHNIALPNRLEGVPVTYDVIGDITPEHPDTLDLAANSAIEGLPSRTGHVDPIPAGVSISHEAVSAGTSGFILTGGGDQYLASNNHVLAASNDGAAGDLIHQPGTIHDGEPVGELEAYHPIEDGTSVDLAWMTPHDVGIETDIVGVHGPYGDVYNPRPGDELVASGITTGVSSGLVRQIDATVDVNFGDDLGTVRLTEQVITTSMSSPGDSGSPVLYDGRPAGMIFAGSDSVSVLMTAANIEAESGMTIATADEPAAVDPESSMWTFQARPDPYSRYEMGVYDGDTYHLEIDQGFRNHRTESVRAMHIDTAEIQHANSEEERELAYEQRDYARQWLREAVDDHDGRWPLLIRTEQAEGKYGRWIAEVYNRSGESLEAAIIDEFGDDYLKADYSREELQNRFDNLAESL